MGFTSDNGIIGDMRCNYRSIYYFTFYFNWSFSELFLIFRAFFNISRKNSKTSEVNQQSVLNLYIFHHFPKNLDRTMSFNIVTLKNTQTEPPKYIIFLTKQIIFRVGG